MAETKRQHIVYVLTQGPSHAEIVLFPFIHAVGALATDIDASIVLMGSAVMVAQKGVAKHVRMVGKPPLDELMKNLFELGGKLYICTPCFKMRGYDENNDLIEEGIPIAAATYNELLLNADAVVSY